jgi:hypothetical protein
MKPADPSIVLIDHRHGCSCSGCLDVRIALQADADTADVTEHAVSCDCTECCLVRTETFRALRAEAKP